MIDPKPPAPPQLGDGPVNNRRVLIVLAGLFLVGLLVLAGMEAFNQLGRRPSAPAPQAAVEVPVVEVQPAPLTLVQPEPAAPEPVVVETPKPIVVVPEPEIVAETPVEATEPPSFETPDAPIEPEPEPEVATAAEIAAPVAVELAVTKAKGKPPVRSTGDIVWSASVYPNASSQYAGTITFADGGTATLVFSRSFITAALTLDLIAEDGPLQGVAAIAVLRADGKDIAIEVGIDHATLLESGETDGSFQTLLDATKLLVALLYENDDTAVLTLSKPAGGELEAVLFSGRQPGQ